MIGQAEVLQFVIQVASDAQEAIVADDDFVVALPDADDFLNDAKGDGERRQQDDLSDDAAGAMCRNSRCGAGR